MRRRRRRRPRARRSARQPSWNCRSANFPGRARWRLRRRLRWGGVRLLALLRPGGAGRHHDSPDAVTSPEGRRHQGRGDGAAVAGVRIAGAQLEERLENLSAVLPEEKDVADILRRIQGIAAQSNLTIQRFTPQPTVQQTMYAEVPFKLQAEGTYHNLGFFFDRISKFPRIINISDISIKAKPKPEPNATIIAECMATTFVLQEGRWRARRARAPCRSSRRWASEDGMMTRTLLLLSTVVLGGAQAKPGQPPAPATPAPAAAAAPAAPAGQPQTPAKAAERSSRPPPTPARDAGIRS